MMKEKQKFTLVEMLVVIAIIAILTSILMPSLQNAINTAKEMSCANNQRMMLLCLSSYTIDYEDYFPASVAHSKAASMGVYRKLFPYASGESLDTSSFNALKPWSDPRQNSIYMCPADDHPWASRTWMGGIDSYYNQPKFSDPRIARSYSANSSLAVYRNTSSSSPDRWSNYVTSTPKGRPVRVVEVKKPYEAMFMLDYWSTYPGNSTLTSRTITLTKNNPSMKTFKVHPHGDLGGINVGFVDGRVQWVPGTYNDLYPSPELKSVASNAQVVK